MSTEDHIVRLQAREIDEHQTIRDNIAKQIDEFFQSGGEVETVPFGMSAERYELETIPHKKATGKTGYRTRYKNKMGVYRSRKAVLEHVRD